MVMLRMTEGKEDPRVAAPPEKMRLREPCRRRTQRRVELQEHLDPRVRVERLHSHAVCNTLLQDGVRIRYAACYGLGMTPTALPQPHKKGSTCRA